MISPQTPFLGFQEGGFCCPFQVLFQLFQLFQLGSSPRRIKG